jgi:hypothetical protein
VATEATDTFERAALDFPAMETLERFARALELRFDSWLFPKGKGAVRLVLDNPAAAKTLNGQRTDYTEIQIAQIKLSHRVGELARAASRLGEAGININYAYVGPRPATVLRGEDGPFSTNRERKTRRQLVNRTSSDC